MSLAIEVDDVAEILLTDGKWYRVKNQSFDIDAYEFLHNTEVLLGGGQQEGVPATGAEWAGPDGSLMCVPLTAIVAVKCHRHTGGVRDPQCSATGDGNGGENSNDSS